MQGWGWQSGSQAAGGPHPAAANGAQRASAGVGPRSQHRDQPGRRGDTQCRFLSIRDPHRRSASPHAPVSCGLPKARIMTAWLISLVGTWGLLTIFATITAESAGVPISSEIVVPLGGALASPGKLYCGHRLI